MPIPKIIHYVWLGGAPLPREIDDCVQSWCDLMPDYEVRRWDESSLGEIDSEFVREAVVERKWAFASDVVRLYALYHHGGIYLDTDVKALKSFDPLLHLNAFVGRESSMHIIGRDTVNFLTTCCIAAEKGNPFIERCLKYYDGRHFVTSSDRSLPAELRLDMRLNSEVMCRLAQEIGYRASVLSNYEQNCGDITVFPGDFFDPDSITANSYCRHLALGSWREGERPVWTYSLLYKIQWRMWAVVERILRKFNRVIIKLR